MSDAQAREVTPRRRRSKKVPAGRPPITPPTPPRAAPAARSQNVTILGALAVVLGAMSLLAVSAARPILSLDPADLAARAPADPSLLPYRDVPALLTFAKASISAALCLAALLVAAGIGVLRRRPWGRTAGITWAAATIVTSVAGAVVNFAWHLPALSRATAASSDPAALAAKYEAIANGAGMTCVSLLMATAFLVAFHRPAIRTELGCPAAPRGAQTGAPTTPQTEPLAEPQTPSAAPAPPPPAPPTAT